MHEKSMTVTIIMLFIGLIVSPLIENVQSCDCGDPPCWPKLSGIMGENNWYVSYVVVTFNGTYNYVYYRINGSNWINYTEPFTLKTEGIHFLEWTCDSNMSNISSLEIKIDYTRPFLSNYTCKRIGLFKWQLGVNATDTVSGINRVEFPFWNFGHNIDTEPPYEFIWRGCMMLFSLTQLFTHDYFWWNAWDNAGNMAPQPSQYLTN